MTEMTTIDRMDGLSGTSDYSERGIFENWPYIERKCFEDRVEYRIVTIKPYPKMIAKQRGFDMYECYATFYFRGRNCMGWKDHVWTVRKNLLLEWLGHAIAKYSARGILERERKCLREYTGYYPKIDRLK